ncbi:hypothetical protein ABZS76_32845 [Streptomyces sp. NPDC005562]|uniref:hypothetical protein n=1 Tax=Streptomyces sp. NPDC005562 TaxID=3154890 RepID=UPI0033BADEFE
MAAAKLSNPMITALLGALARRLRTAEGTAYQVDVEGRWATVKALVTRGKVVMETRQVIGASGATFQATGAWMTEDGVSFLRDALEYVTGHRAEERREPYRTFLADAGNADTVARFLLGDPHEVNTVANLPHERQPQRETITPRDAVERLGNAIRNDFWLSFEDGNRITVHGQHSARWTFIPVAAPVDVEDMKRRFLAAMDSVTRTNNTSGLADLMRHISLELWPVIKHHKLTPPNATLILAIEEAAETTHLQTLAHLGRRAGEIWGYLLRREAERRAAAGENGTGVSYAIIPTPRPAVAVVEETLFVPDDEPVKEPLTVNCADCGKTVNAPDGQNWVHGDGTPLCSSVKAAPVAGTEERPSRYTVTETFRDTDNAAVWTARVGRTVAVTTVAPMDLGMWDTDLLRKALAQHAGVTMECVRPVRARSEIAVAPRVWEVDYPEADMLPLPVEESAPAPTTPSPLQHTEAEIVHTVLNGRHRDAILAKAREGSKALDLGRFVSYHAYGMTDRQVGAVDWNAVRSALLASGTPKDTEDDGPLDEMGTDRLLEVLREHVGDIPADSTFARAWALMDRILTDGGIECLPAPWDGYADARDCT